MANTPAIQAFSRVVSADDLESALTSLDKSYWIGLKLITHRVYTAIILAKNPRALELFIEQDPDFCAERVPHLCTEMGGIKKPYAPQPGERAEYTDEQVAANRDFWRSTATELCRKHGISMPW